MPFVLAGWIPDIAPILDTTERQQRFAAAHPLGRLGTSEDIAYFALYLAADESSWVTVVSSLSTAG